MMSSEQIETIDEYKNSFPVATQEIIQRIRDLIHDLCPDVKEKIGYGIPTFTLRGKNLVHVGAYEHHIGLYPGPPAIEAFQAELKNFKTSKGTIQFPLDKPIPYELIQKITLYRVKSIDN